MPPSPATFRVGYARGFLLAALVGRAFLAAGTGVPHPVRVLRGGWGFRRSTPIEQLFPDPVFRPASLNRARFVSFRQFVRHKWLTWGQPPPLVQPSTARQNYSAF